MPRPVRLLSTLVAAGSLVAATGIAQAQSPAEEALRKRVEELEAKLKRLEDRLDQQTAATGGAGAPPPTATGATSPDSPSPAAAPTPAVAVSGVDATDARGAREAALQQRVEQLDQEVKVLGRKQELDREAMEARVKETPIVTAGAEGFRIRSPDNAFQLRLGAQLHADSRWFFGEQAATDGRDQFLLRRVRPIFEGTVFDKYGFRIMPDFAGGTLQILDAYVDWNYDPAFKIRAGKFKGPVSWERLQSPSAIFMMERTFPSQLSPNRELGIQVSGDLFHGTLSYQAGIFNGTVDGSSTDGDSNNAKDFEARVIAWPFRNTDKDALRGLRFGVAYTTGSQDGSSTSSQLPRFLTPGQNTLFAYSTGAFANGNRARVMPQFYYSNGPFGLFGEYIVSEQTVQRSTNQRQLSNSAWQLTGSYVVTGEDATLDGIRPRKIFDPKAGTWGALELVGRVANLSIDKDAFVGGTGLRLANPDTQAQKAREYGLGLNWYLNRQYRVMVNYEYTSFDGGRRNGDREDEHVLMTRFQLWL